MPVRVGPGWSITRRSRGRASLARRLARLCLISRKQRMAMPTPLRLLLLEDEPADARRILHELEQAGYEPTGERVQTERDYLARLQDSLDLILAEYRMPQLDAPRA